MLAVLGSSYGSLVVKKDSCSPQDFMFTPFVRSLITFNYGSNIWKLVPMSEPWWERPQGISGWLIFLFCQEINVPLLETRTKDIEKILPAIHTSSANKQCCCCCLQGSCGPFLSCLCGGFQPWDNVGCIHSSPWPNVSWDITAISGSLSLRGLGANDLDIRLKFRSRLGLKN